MILSLADARETLVLGEHEEDALNEVSNTILVDPLTYTKEESVRLHLVPTRKISHIPQMQE